jgi:hypothetical protein
MRLIEFHEQPWFPTLLRDYVTEGLQFVLSLGGVYKHCSVRLRNALLQSGSTRIVDLCSGGSGPWFWLKNALKKEGLAPEIWLTDKFPNHSVFQEAEYLGMYYAPFSVNATNVPPEISGFRTMFSSFHHFPPKDATQILRHAVDQRQGIGIFEAARRSPLTILLTTFMLIGGFVAAPFQRPFRLSRLFWTYIIPVVPLVLYLDGLVSCLRSYSPHQLQAMVSSLDAPDYVWEIGEENAGLVTVTYLLGYPRQSPTHQRAHDSREASFVNSAPQP